MFSIKNRDSESISFGNMKDDEFEDIETNEDIEMPNIDEDDFIINDENYENDELDDELDDDI